MFSSSFAYAGIPVSKLDTARNLQEYVVKSRECLQKADPALGSDCPHLQKLKVMLLPLSLLHISKLACSP